MIRMLEGTGNLKMLTKNRKELVIRLSTQFLERLQML